MTSEEVNIETSVRVALLLILDCSSCQSYQRIQRTLPCQHTVCNKCIERSRRTGVLTCAECGTLHKIPKEWTRLFPINLQLHQIAQCAELYRTRVASPGGDETVVLSGGDGGGGYGDDVSNEDTSRAMLLEQIEILETSEEIYADIFSRIADDIDRFVKSGESGRIIILERMQELRRLVDGREATLLEQIKKSERHEIGILKTKLIENQKEVKTIKMFCIEARKFLSTGDVTNLDELIKKSSTLMDVFRQAKTSRSRVPKVIVFVDRSAPKKRLKANINTYGKLIVESAMSTSEDVATEDVEEDKKTTPTLSIHLDDITQPIEATQKRNSTAVKDVEKVDLDSPLRHDHMYLRVPVRHVGGDGGNGTRPTHFRNHSNDSGIEEVTVAGSPGSSPPSFLKLQPREALSGARKKSRPLSQKFHRVDYSQSRIKLTVGGFGKGRDNFNVPKGVAAVKDNIFAVADCGNNSVKLFESSNDRVTVFINCEGIMKFPLPSVVDVCTLGGTSLLVSVSRESKLLHYTSSGKYVCTHNVPTAGTSSDIWGITSDFHENIYICDRANGCVLQFDKEMRKIREFRSFLSQKRSCPFYVTIGPDNRIYTTDSASNTILIFTPDGRNCQEINGENPAKGFPKFEALAGLAFDSTGNLFLVDRGRSKIIVMEPRMENQYIFGNVEVDIGKPEGIAVLANGNVVVSETSHHQTLIF